MTSRFTRLSARFPRKRVFITGAGSGLGLELAKLLADDGWTLGLFDRNLDRLTSVEAQFTDAGVKVVAYPGDVTQADELTVAVNSFAATHDGLDVMINNAGVAGAGSMMEVSLEDWRWIIDINVMGVVHGSRAAIPHLQRNGNGLLINVASAAAFASAPGMVSYNATKAAVVSISETLVNELRPIGTQVSVVMPSFFRSSLLETLRGPEHARACEPDNGEIGISSGASRARFADRIRRRPYLHRATQSGPHDVANETLDAAAFSRSGKKLHAATTAGPGMIQFGESTASKKRV